MREDALRGEWRKCDRVSSTVWQSLIKTMKLLYMVLGADKGAKRFQETIQGNLWSTRRAYFQTIKLVTQSGHDIRLSEPLMYQHLHKHSFFYSLGKCKKLPHSPVNLCHMGSVPVWLSGFPSSKTKWCMMKIPSTQCSVLINRLRQDDKIPKGAPHDEKLITKNLEMAKNMTYNTDALLFN